MRTDDIPQPNFDVFSTYQVTGRTLNALCKALIRRTPKPGANVQIQEDADGFTISAAAGGGGGACAFGQVVIVGADYYLTAGPILAGPSVHLPDPYLLSVASDGTYQVWLEIDLTANESDGLLLPGIASSSAPAWGNGSTIPDQTLPTVPSAEGTAIVPVATVTVASGVATAIPLACGPLTITHCPGTLGTAPYL